MPLIFPNRKFELRLLPNHLHYTGEVEFTQAAYVSQGTFIIFGGEWANALPFFSSFPLVF